MLHLWTKHIVDPDEKARFETEITHSHILRRLNQLLDQAEREIESSEKSIKAYDNPNWAFRQAHVNGERQAISKVRSLITFDQKDKHDR